MKSNILVAILLLYYAVLDEALQCYSHDTCSTNCPKLSNTIRSCTGDDNRCYKSAFPSGIACGCSKERCNLQITGSSILANVCCEKDLCNSTMTSRLTL
ncbi:unnamed protein product [Rotaria sp. Silwood1]|nr:unnamed protein product [Rotaria sp. Silwood1]CAF1607900.1 unnamed protein product [Rotaria sp. Silwood1]